jgi:uncharacterized membrane protein YGL010W
MRRTGVLKRFVESTWPSKVEVPEAALLAVSVDMIIMLLLLLAVGIAAALLCLILEAGERKMRSRFLPNY